MHTRTGYCATLILFLVSFTAGAGGAQVDPFHQSEFGRLREQRRTEVLKQHARYVRALGARDISRLRGFLAPSFTLVVGAGEPLNRQQMLDSLADRFHQHPNFRRTVEVERVAVKEWVMLLTTEADTCTDTLGNEHQNRTRYLETWKKLAGRWQMVEKREQ